MIAYDKPETYGFMGQDLLQNFNVNYVIIRGETERFFFITEIAYFVLSDGIELHPLQMSC